MIEADFAEFIDDDERARRGIAEQAVQEARFSGAKKTCDTRQRERRGRLPSMGCFLVLYNRRPRGRKNRIKSIALRAFLVFCFLSFPLESRVLRADAVWP